MSYRPPITLKMIDDMQPPFRSMEGDLSGHIKFGSNDLNQYAFDGDIGAVGNQALWPGQSNVTNTMSFTSSYGQHANNDLVGDNFGTVGNHCAAGAT